jgi:hypothetical protein
MSMKATMFGVMGALVLLGGTGGAEARPQELAPAGAWQDEDDAPRRIQRTHRPRVVHDEDGEDEAPRRVQRTKRASVAREEVGTPNTTLARGTYNAGARPGAWCGWWMRTRRGGGPEYNLAWNWSRWGKPSGPQVGAVVVWHHHVGEITGRTKNGQWIIRSGNDGGRVRERPRSVAGAVFRMG